MDMSAGAASLCSALLLVSLLLFVSAEQKTITAESGNRVTLPCRAPNKYNIRAVVWSKAGSRDGKNVLVYQFVVQHYMTEHSSFKNRVELKDRQMKDGDVSVILKDVNTADTGRYECRVYMREPFRLLSIIYLSVAPPPDDKFLTADPGQDVTLTCRAPNNNPKFIHWSRADLEPEYLLLYRDGQFLPGDQFVSFKNRVDLRDRQMKDGDVSLILKNVMTADTGTYNCRVFMEEKRSWESICRFTLTVPPEKQTITAETGQSVTLPCRAPNNITVLYWSRADLEPEHLLVYRDGQIVPDNQHPYFRKRVDLRDRQMKDGDASVILKNVTTADNGTYKCHIFMEETHSWKLSIINLSVPPEQKIIITAESGQNVTLPCRAPNYNITLLYWSRADLEPENLLVYRDGQIVPDYQHLYFKKRVDLQDGQMKDGDASVILKDVTTADNGTYQCRVFMEETRSWKLSIIDLSVHPDNKSITAESGQSITLPCRAPNDNIKFVHWSRADLEPEYLLVYQDWQFLPDYRHPSLKNLMDLQDRQMKDGDVSLILKDVTTADDGTYQCRVFMEETRSWKLSMIYLSVTPDHKILTVDPGQNITLPCRAPNINIKFVHWSRADLEPEYVLVYREGQFLTANQHPSFRKRVDMQDGQMKDGDVSVILKDVTAADDGTYQCRVFMEETLSWKLSIINLSVPPYHKNITAESGQNVTLPCRAPNNNIIDVIEWIRPDLQPEYVLVYRDERFDPDNQHPSFKNRVDLRYRQMKDGDVSLNVNHVTINDTGTYECHVFMIGTNHKNTKPISSIYLRVVDPPDPPGGDADGGGNEGGGNEGGSVGLIVGLTLSAVLLLLLIVLIVVLSNRKSNQSQRSNAAHHQEIVSLSEDSDELS
ncbi:hemicentin-2-like [Archocentrus centrarchus]|uniref:hemicentin-2-like n=1 Tax=Archocentrus centrarchus TaxID=63155 RepID=UPI0011EA16DD|nr:hemicentin-2-like [Archocentrus centrarchus]